MALNSPPSIEIEQIQFKIHDEFQIFEERSGSGCRSYINLLATSSTNGLVFLGNPNKPELKVVQLKTIVDSRDNDGKFYARTFQIPNKANCMAMSCDGQFLAVNYTLNNSGFLVIYRASTFYSNNTTPIFNIRISPNDNVEVLQILWNPIIPSTLALIMNDGSVGMYNFKDSNYEFHSLDKSQQVLCGCWSPKGKQIVFGFINGKIAQFKPDLKLARTIECPPNIIEGSFITIAIQWLSTYQFAVAYLQNGDDMTPNLYIVNAPKTGQPTYINYFDICYSSSGPRKPQIFFIHVQHWNLLLVANSNSMEIGLLGTNEIGEAPIWTEYSLNDSCRLSLPMTKDKQETHPIGFCLETGSSHQLIIGENEIPVMPMVHLLSTHGKLISFDFLNLSPNAPGICSPPTPVTDQSGQPLFTEVNTKDVIESKQQPALNEGQSLFDLNANKNLSAIQTQTSVKPNFFGQPSIPTQIQGFTTGPSTQLSFGSGQTGHTNSNIGATLSSSAGLFGNNLGNFGSGGFISGNIHNQQNQPLQQITSFTTSASIENQNKQSSVFSGIKSVNTDSISIPSTVTERSIPSVTNFINPDKNKPLYTVQPTFVSPISKQPLIEDKESLKIVTMNEQINLKDSVSNDYLHEMIKTEIQCFELELKELSSKSKDVSISIGNMEIIKNYTKKIDQLQDEMNIIQDNEFENNIHMVRHSLNECFTMLAEVRSKLEFFENPDLSKVLLIPSNDQSSRRQLARLNSMLATNDSQLKLIKQQIDANWSQFQDIVNRNSVTRIHTPSLEGIYQTMTKQKNILARERQKIAHIKTKLNFPGLQLKNATTKKQNDINADSLADSILSMSLSEQIIKENSKLTKEKLQTIRDVLQNRKVIKIIPQRPDRLQSEIIIKSMKKNKKSEKEAVELAAKDKKNDLILRNETDINSELNKLLGISNENIIKQKGVTIVQPTSPFVLKPQFNPVSPAPLFANTSCETENILVPKTIGAADQKSSASASNISSVFKPQSNISVTGPQPNETIQQKPFGISGNSLFNNVNSAPGSSNTPFANFAKNFTPVTSISEFTLNANASFVPKTVSNLQNTSKTQTPLIISSVVSLTTTSVSKPQSSQNPQQIQNTIVPFGSVQTSLPSKGTGKDPDTAFLDDLSICKPNLKAQSTTTQSNIFGTASLVGEHSVNSALSTSSNMETKPNFLNTFSSNSKSSLFGGNPIVANNNQVAETPTSFNFTSNAVGGTLSKTSSSFNFPQSLSENVTNSKSTSFDQGVSFTLPSISDASKNSETTTSTVSTFLCASTPTVTAASPSSFSFLQPGMTITTLNKSELNTKSNDSPTSVEQNTLTSSTDASKPIAFGLTKSPAVLAFGSKLTSTDKPCEDIQKLGDSDQQKTIMISSSATLTKPVENSSSTTSSLHKSNSEPTSSIPSNIFGHLSLVSNLANTSKAAESSLQPQKNLFSSSNLAMANKRDESKENEMFGTGQMLQKAFTTGPNTTQTSTASGIPAPVNSRTLTEEQSFTPTSTTTNQIFSTNTSETTSTFTLSALNLSNSTFPSLASTSVATPTAVTSAPSAFGSSAFGSSTTVSTATSTSIFSSTPTSAINSTSIFGGSLAGPSLTQPTVSSSTTPTSGGNIFGGVPKPDQSVFNQSNSFGNIFAQAVTQVPQFSQKPNSSSTPASIFGGGANTFGTTGFSNMTSANNTGSVFGGNTDQTKSTETGNIFGTSSNNATSTGALFGNSPFNLTTNNAEQQTTTSIFGGAQSTTTPFGSGSSIFGGSSTNPVTSSTSPFGGATSFSSGVGTGTTGFGGFGNTTSNFQNTSGGGAFGQPLPAFNAATSPLQKPTFGGAPTFGSPSAFGTSSPTFGGAPTFGSGIKAFGGFPSPTNNTNNPTSGGNVFETLGSSSDALTFGNLAQNANSNAAKPNFGAGSSFSTWR